MGNRAVKVVLVVLEIGNAVSNAVFNNVFDIPLAGKLRSVHQVGLRHIGNLDVGRELIHNVWVGKRWAIVVYKIQLQLSIKLLSRSDSGIAKRSVMACILE